MNNDNTQKEIVLPKLEQLMDNLPGGFFVYRADDSEEILYVNDVALDIFGCGDIDEFKELTGYTFKGMVHPDDLEAVENSITNQIAESDKKLDYVEYRIIRKDGSIRWVDDYGRFVNTKEYGDIYCVFIRDITELHDAREENWRRAEVIEGLSIDFTSIYLLNLDTGSMRPYRLQNEYFKEIYKEIDHGKNEAADWRSILPVYAERYVVPEDRERYLREVSEECIRERLKSENTYTVDYRMKGKKETTFMQMSVVRIDDDRLYQHALIGYRDVTEQVHRIRKETAKRLQMELELEQEKHTHQAKSAFLFNISHDIRTPMNAIMGFTELSLRHINEPELLKDYLGKVNESNHHMLALIDDLLEMSQIDSGKVQLKPEECDLNEQLVTVIDMMQAQAEEKGIELKADIKLPEDTVCVDALRFRRIMTNLIGNAVKFTPENGTVTVSAYSKEVSKSGYARYEFVVADSGIGMSEEFMNRMFKSFEREETSTKTGYKGVGLGLSIVKSLLDIMGGSISAESKKGKGSTFTINLPLKLADGTGQQEKSIASADTEHKAEGEHRILLVEDIEINRMLAENILKESGFLVDSVPDGCDAVEAITNSPLWYYDLVLMDIQMPVMNGYEATRAIRAIQREDTESIPIIALSANAREEDKRLSIESGMNSHVAKPFDIAKLIATINEHINNRGV